MSSGTLETLARVRARRGYTLSYHEMLAGSDPDLLTAYDEFYNRLTLGERYLTPVDRELVWIGILTAAREAHGTIHLRRAEQLGIPAEQMADAVALAAAAELFPLFKFTTTHWGQWITDELTLQRYRNVVAAARGSLSERVSELILVGAHAARRNQAGLALHLKEAFAQGATPGEVAETLSFLLLPCGGPTLIDAADVWRELARQGAVPSPGEGIDW